MIKFKKSSQGSAVILELLGEIDESLNLKAMIGDPPQELIINCRGVSRANSTGIGLWIAYFQSVPIKQKLTLVECSPVVVEAINMISNFVCHGCVKSIYVPFECESCNLSYMELHETKDLMKYLGEAPLSNCSKCKSPATFDDSANEYFGFLERNSVS